MLEQKNQISRSIPEHVFAQPFFALLLSSIPQMISWQKSIWAKKCWGKKIRSPDRFLNMFLPNHFLPCYRKV